MRDCTILTLEELALHLRVFVFSFVAAELYPVRFANSTGIVDGTPTRALEARRPTYWEWIGAPAMQQFEFEANYAVGQFAYHNGGRLAILPGPCHFLDMDKVADSSVFESFNRDILRYGSELVTDHWLKLYVMAEDRHLSTLYATKTKWKTSWVSGAYFFYKPEKTWTDMLQQRIRWQGGTLVSHAQKCMIMMTSTHTFSLLYVKGATLRCCVSSSCYLPRPSRLGLVVHKFERIVFSTICYVLHG